MKLENTTAVVTGASTGIGREIATKLAENHVKIALVGRDRKGLKETAEKIASVGGTAELLRCDLRKEEQITRAANKILSKWKRIDIIVNAAGVWHNKDKPYYGPLLYETPADEINEVVDVGIRAPLHLARQLLPPMIANKAGKIINISGTFESGAKGWLHYYISKKAIEQFTVGLSEELREHEIQVNCISPSDTATPAYKRFFPEYYADAISPQEIAKFALFLASPAAAHITGSVTVIKNKKPTSITIARPGLFGSERFA